MKLKNLILLIAISLFVGCKNKQGKEGAVRISPSIEEHVLMDNVFVSGGIMVYDMDGNPYFLLRKINSIECYKVETGNDSINLKFLWKREGLTVLPHVNYLDPEARTDYIAALISPNPVKRMRDKDTIFKIKVYSLKLKTGKIVDSTFYISTSGSVPAKDLLLQKNWLFVSDRNLKRHIRLPSKYVIFRIDKDGKFKKRLDVPFASYVVNAAIIKDRYALVSTALYYNLVRTKVSGVSDWFTGVFLISLDDGKILDHLVVHSGTYGSSFIYPTSSDSEWVIYDRCYFCERCGATIYKVRIAPLRIVNSISFDEGVAVGRPFRFKGKLLYPSFLINSKKLLLLDENLKIFREIPCTGCEDDSVYVMHYTSLKSRRGTDVYVYTIQITGMAPPAVVVIRDKTGQIVKDPSNGLGKVRNAKGDIEIVPEVFVYLPPYNRLNLMSVIPKRGIIPTPIIGVKDRLAVFSSEQHNRVVLRELKLFSKIK